MLDHEEVLPGQWKDEVALDALEAIPADQIPPGARLVSFEEARAAGMGKTLIDALRYAVATYPDTQCYLVQYGILVLVGNGITPEQAVEKYTKTLKHQERQRLGDTWTVALEKYSAFQVEFEGLSARERQLVAQRWVDNRTRHSDPSFFTEPTLQNMEKLMTEYSGDNDAEKIINCINNLRELIAQVREQDGDPTKDPSDFEKAKQCGLIDHIVEAFESIEIVGDNSKPVSNIGAEKGRYGYDNSWFYIVLTFEDGKSARLRIYLDSNNEFARFNDFAFNPSSSERLVLNEIIHKVVPANNSEKKVVVVPNVVEEVTKEVIVDEQAQLEAKKVDFAAKKQRARALLLSQIDKLNGAVRSRLVSVTDTGLGGSAHYDQIDRNRRHNGAVERDAAYQSRLLYDLIDGLDKQQNTSGLWTWLCQELRDHLLVNNEQYQSCFKSSEAGGGINWHTVYQLFRESSMLDRSRVGLLGALTGLEAVYSCFWR